MQDNINNGTPLEKYLYDLTRSIIKNDSSSGNRSKSIHVTSLTQPCVRRTYYDLTHPKKEISYESAAIFRIGQIVHSGVVLNPERNETSMGANIRTMKPIEVKDINPINFFDCITGTIDDIIEHNGETIIVDKKTFSTLKRWEPKEAGEDYIFQLNEYKLLYYINFGKEIKKGAIVYLDTASRFEKIKVFEIQLDTIENIKVKVLAKLDLLKSGKVPPRVTSWRCDYCPHATKELCDPEQDPTFKFKVKK